MDSNSLVTTEASSGANVSALFVRMVGVAVMLAGLYGAYQVAARAWELFDNQSLIVRFSEEIEKQSHLNVTVAKLKTVFEFFDIAKTTMTVQQGETKARPSPEMPPEVPELNASYFAAWLIVIVLLGLVARICLWAVGEGGKLAVCSVDNEQRLKAVLRELIQEIKTARP